MKRRRGRALRRRYGHADAAGGTYMVKYVHKISPSEKDVAGPIHLSANDLKDRKSLAAALRRQKILMTGGTMRFGEKQEHSLKLGPGETVKQFRIEAGGKIVVFPGGKSLWWSIILTPMGG